MILLDTCTFLWITSDPGKIGKNAEKLILRHKDSLFVSAISAFEIRVKAHKGQLKLPFEIEKWFEESLEFHGISEMPMSSAIAIQSTRLPFLHRDPCDRIIIATARTEACTVVTSNEKFRLYDVPIIDARR